MKACRKRDARARCAAIINAHALERKANQIAEQGVRDLARERGDDGTKL